MTTSFSRASRGFALALACAALPALAVPAAAQTPLVLEVRGGITQPHDSFGDDTGADGGWSSEFSVTWRALPFIGVYGAYQRAEFDREGGAEGSVITDAGWAAGMRVGVPTPFIPIDPWIRAGVVRHEIEAGALDDGGGTGVGMEIGGGLRFGLGRASVTPGVVWTRYRFDDETVADGRVDVRYLRAEVGVRLGI